MIGFRASIVLRVLKKGSGSKHFKNLPFLKALGAHCQRIRLQKGYSIDRLAREGEQLSSSVIHRLENGAGAVTVSALFRYAATLGVHPKALLDFDLEAHGDPGLPRSSHLILPADHPRVKAERFKSLLPLYSLKAAAGHFGVGRAVEPSGWVEVPAGRRLDGSMFVAQAVGRSMEPGIRDGDFLVFKQQPAGSRQGKVVLAQYRGPADPETGGSYTVKRYSSTKIAAAEGWRHREVKLAPDNPEFEPIVLLPAHENDFAIVAEYLFTLA